MRFLVFLPKKSSQFCIDMPGLIDREIGLQPIVSSSGLRKMVIFDIRQHHTEI